MSSRFSRHGTTGYRWPKVCRSNPPVLPPQGLSPTFTLTSTPGSFSFPLNRTVNFTDSPLIRTGADTWKIDGNGTNSSVWHITFKIPLGGGSITSTLTMTSPSGNTTGNANPMTWSGLTPSTSNGSWTRETGGSLTGGVTLHLLTNY